MEQVRSSIARRLGLEIQETRFHTPAVSRHVDSVVEMMPDATQNYALPLTRKRLFGWHAGLFPTGFNSIYKITTWAKIAGCSQDTALRDIRDLIGKGILRQEEGGGRSTGYGLRIAAA